MASITIRDLDDHLKARLRVRATHHGRSMEEEARHILRAALTEERQPATNLSDSIRRRFAPLAALICLTLSVNLYATRQDLSDDRPRHQRIIQADASRTVRSLADCAGCGSGGVSSITRSIPSPHSLKAIDAS